MPSSINDLKQRLSTIKFKAKQARAMRAVMNGNYMRNDPDRGSPDLVVSVTVREIVFTIRADEY